MRRASTVIVLRRSDNAILMVERKSSNRAFAGAMVFPGGVEEDADSSWPKVEAAKVCALRELFEETGMLVGKQATSATRALQGPCNKDAALFKGVYEEAELNAAAARLKLWSVWVTPQQEKYRYHTTFFALGVSDAEASAAVHDNVEVVSSHFATAETFLARHARDELFLIPPTWVTLRELAGLGSVEKIMASQRSATVIEPTLHRTAEQYCVCLPGDMNHSQSLPTAAGLRRVVIAPGQPFRWVDTIGNTTVPTSSL